jgi:hypothetical protein
MIWVYKFIEFTKYIVIITDYCTVSTGKQLSMVSISVYKWYPTVLSLAIL